MTSKLIEFRQTKSVLPILLIVCIGAALSIYAFFHFAELETNKKKAGFYHQAGMQVDAVNAEIQRALFQVQSLHGLFTVHPNLTRSEFRNFVSFLDKGNAAHAYEWIPRVPGEKRTDYERRVREQGLSGFQITERATQGHLIPAGKRAEYFPVEYIEPLKGNESAIGFDIASNSVRREALVRSWDSGQIVASSRITLVQQGEDQYGFLVLAPVYTDAAPTDLIEDRRKKLRGFGLIVLRVADLVKAALKRGESEASDFDVFVFDESGAPGEQLVYPRGAEPQAKLAVESPLQHSLSVNVADRSWSILVVPEFGSPFLESVQLPYWMLLVGLLLTSQAVLYVFSVQSRSTFAQKLVDEKDRIVNECQSGIRGNPSPTQKDGLVRSAYWGSPIANSSMTSWSTPSKWRADLIERLSC